MEILNYGDKFIYNQRRLSFIKPKIKIEHSIDRYLVNAVDIDTGEIIFVPDNEEVDAIKFSPFLVDTKKISFSKLFFGAKFHWNGFECIKVFPIYTINLQYEVNAIILSDGRGIYIKENTLIAPWIAWGNENEIFRQD